MDVHNFTKIKSHLVLFLFIASYQLACIQNENAPSIRHNKEIIEKYLKNGASKHHYLSKEWEEWTDRGIQKDSTITLLWQQNVLPLWKQKKYEAASKYFDKAVYLDRKQWLSRLSYLECIFAKDYSKAIVSLNDYIDEYGSTFEQGHKLEFYVGLFHLELNQFGKALKILSKHIISEETRLGDGNVHYLDRYYLAVVYFELNDYNKALEEFDKILIQYPNFSDAQFFKSICLLYRGEKKNAMDLMEIGKSNHEKGYSFKEENNFYEVYPYQITWQWKSIKSIFI